MTPKKSPRARSGNPFRGVLDMITEMNRISDTMASIESGGHGQARGYADAWSPATDIFARENDLVIRCEIPGVYEDDVELTFSHGLLTIAGERRRDDDEVVYYSSERYMGRFRREITLPESVDAEDIDAVFSDGLLEVTVKNAAESASPKQIAVKRLKRRG